MSTRIGRRKFAVTVGVGTAGFFATGLKGIARGYPANEIINVGCVGTGGRCRRLMETLKRISGVRLTAVCDVYDLHLERAKQIAGPEVFATKHYPAVLDRKDVDVVLIGSPDHWHVPLTVAACEAGKDVYVEKPLTHKLSEGAVVIEAQNKHKRIVQVGMQQRSLPHYHEANEMIKAGEIGTVHKVHLAWNRNAKQYLKAPAEKIDPRSVDWKMFLGTAREQPFDPYRFRQWRWFWDFGAGILSDLMVHHIDVANWFLDLGHPAMGTAIGDNFATEGIWETPDTMQALLRYPEQKVQVHFEGTFVNARNRSSLEFMGTEATLYINQFRYEVHPEPGRTIQPKSFIIGDNPRGFDPETNPDADLQHLTNWIECVRNRKKPHAPAEAGVAAVEGAHLGNRAYLAGQVARWKL